VRHASIHSRSRPTDARIAGFGSLGCRPDGPFTTQPISRAAVEHLDFIPRLLREPGVEIGAFKTPLPGIAPIYLDRFAEYAGERTLADYYGDACSIPFRDASLAYVASSHVIEHVANPLAALREWCRVLRHNGVIYMVVPDRRKTFDHLRPLTPVTHLLDDFRTGTTQVDGTHIDEFTFGVDWALFSPATKPEDVASAQRDLVNGYREAIRQGTEINIHFHTFEPGSMAELIAAGNAQRLWPGSLDVEIVCEDFPSSNPNGFLIVARYRRPFLERWRRLGRPTGLLPSATKLPSGHPCR
jgi:hypothetical protein